MRRTSFPATAILAVVAAFFLLVGFGGCDARTDGKDPVQVKKDQTVAQVASNLKPIGRSLHDTGRPAEGKAVSAQASILDDVVEVDPFDIPAPVATYEEWMSVKNDAAAKAELAKKFEFEAQVVKAELAEVKAANNSWWAWLRDGSAIAGLLASGAAVYRGLGGPGSQLIDLGLKVAFPKGFAALQGNVAKLADKNEVLVTAVAASDVGREALAHLDTQMRRLPPEAQNALTGLLSAATGGKADTLEGFFKTFAKGYAIDEGEASRVDSTLTEIRNNMDTKGGRSEAFMGILHALAEAAGQGRAAT